MSDDTTDDRPPFDPERLERLRAFMERRESLMAGYHRRIFEIDGDIAKLSAAISTHGEHRQDSSILAMKRKVETLKARRQALTAERQREIDAARGMPALFENCLKFARQHGWRDGLGFYSAPAPDAEADKSLPPLPHHAERAAEFAAKQEGRRR
jgi:hypothetical protein